MTTPTPQQELLVYLAHAFAVTDGVAEGDAITFADDLVMDDVYVLAPGVDRRTLSVEVLETDGRFRVVAGSPLGQAGNIVHLDSCLTLMAPDGSTSEALILVEVEDQRAADIYLLPLASIEPGLGYRLVGLDRQAATKRLAEASCVSFTRGTRITMASGEQRPIEDVRPGDKVLTRDDGPQEVRWVGQTTLRATGSFAPVLIKEGALHNANDLLVSPDHRLFIYQRHDTLGAGRSEVLIKARHLINGTTVVQQDGGYIDYFQVLFDEHHIIYAEGIAAESLLIDPRTRAALPDALTEKGHARRAHHSYEVEEAALANPDAVALLKRASSSG